MSALCILVSPVGDYDDPLDEPVGLTLKGNIIYMYLYSPLSLSLFVGATGAVCRCQPLRAGCCLRGVGRGC